MGQIDFYNDFWYNVLYDSAAVAEYESDATDADVEDTDEIQHLSLDEFFID